METYNELLEEFNQKESSKQLLINYKYLRSEISNSSILKRHTIKKKMYELRNMRKNNYLSNVSHIDHADQFSFMNTFISSPQFDESHSKVQQASSDVHSNSELLTFAQIQNTNLKMQINNLKDEIIDVKAMIQQVNGEIALFENGENTIETSGKQFQNYLSQIHAELSQHYQKYRDLMYKNEQTFINLSEKKKQLKAELFHLANEYERRKSNKNQILNYQKQASSQKPAKIIKEKYSKMLFQQILRAFYLIIKLEKNWNDDIPYILEDEERALIKKSQIRLMSKINIVEYYQSKGVLLADGLAQQISQFYSKLENSFDRIERANNQITQSFRTLGTYDESLNITLKVLKEKTERNTMISLQKQEINLNQMTQRLNHRCRLIFQFNIRIHELLKKMLKFNKTLDQIIRSAKNSVRQRFQRKSFLEINRLVLQKFQLLLERNPEDVLLLWNQIINDSRAGKQYADVVMKNDLLRVHASPQMYDPSLSELENQENTYNLVFSHQDNLIKLLFEKLKSLLSVTIQGIIQLGGQEAYKEKSNPNIEQEVSYCVESSSYFRRDNYKILEKLEKQQLKKRGLLLTIPFSPNLQNQLEYKNEADSIKIHPVYTASASTRDFKLAYFKKEKQKYNQLSFKRQELNSRTKSLRKLFQNLSNVASKNVKLRYQRKSNLSERELVYPKIGEVRSLESSFLQRIK